MAWQLGLTRKDIRRNEAYYRLHNFLISETENGTISRQETVSMIPPLVLDVQPHHKVCFIDILFMKVRLDAIYLMLIIKCLRILILQIVNLCNLSLIGGNILK